MESTLRAHLLELARLYEEAAARPLPSLGKDVMNDTKFFRRIENGDGFTVKTFDRVVQWFSDHWPEGAEWPQDVERPARSEVSA